MTEGLVSVVLPIYKVEKYLDRCIESVVNQSYRNLQIILVDDGSPDNCPVLCDKWAEKDSRIKVVHKKNAGLGMARNTGIENADGEFICFFDSDDFVAEDTVEKAYTLAKEKNAEIVTFGFCNVNSDGVTVKTSIPETEKEVYEGEEILDEFLPDMIGPDTSNGRRTNLWMSMCGSLFSMELIQRTGWRSVSERENISEDVYSLLVLYKDVRCVAVLPESFYSYCENATSLTHTYRKDRYEKIKHFYDDCIEACDKSGYSDKIKKRLMYPYLSYTIAAMKMIASASCGCREKAEAIKNIIYDGHLRDVLKEYDLTHETKLRKILLTLMKKRMSLLCYFLVRLKAK